MSGYSEYKSAVREKILSNNVWTDPIYVTLDWQEISYYYAIDPEGWEYKCSNEGYFRGPTKILYYDGKRIDMGYITYLWFRFHLRKWQFLTWLYGDKKDTEAKQEIEDRIYKIREERRNGY